MKVLEKRLGQQKNEAQTDFSSTFVPYYDSIIDKKFRNLLGEIKVDELTKAMVEQHNYRLRAQKEELQNQKQQSNDMYSVEK